MKQSVLRSLTEADTVLVLQTTRKNLDTLDEDQLAALHARVLRARNKHVSVYRRGAAARVETTGTRGGARPGNQANRDRIEVFEDALSRVSKRLAAVARASADALRNERIAAAKEATGTPVIVADGPSAAPKAAGSKVVDRSVRTPIKKKQVAGAAAVGARKQAKKDSK